MARPKSDVLKRFNEKVLAVESGCHEWQSTVKKTGYGSFYFNGKQERAHRVSFILKVGPIPDGALILHRCDNRKCVNIEHLFLGTTAENIADMDSKKRRGTKSSLNVAQVAEIKRLLKQRHSQQSIADRFGVCQSVISRIKLGKTSLFKPI